MDREHIRRLVRLSGGDPDRPAETILMTWPEGMPLEEFQRTARSVLEPFLSGESGGLVVSPDPARMRGLLREVLDSADPEREVGAAAPGRTASELLGFVFSGRAKARVFDQVLADMQEEWTEATRAGDHREAQRIRLRGHAALLLTAVAHLVATVWDKVREIRRVI